MKSTPRQLLKDLVDAPAPTGFEAPAVKAWQKYLKAFSDEQYTDSYGNGYAVLNPAGDPTVMLCGHADEIGLMVTYIDDEGFLWVGSLGGYDAKILPSMRVKVFGRGKPLPGVIGAMPPHLQNPATGGTAIKRYKFGENIYIDIGAKNKAEAEKRVRVGDPVILDYGYTEMAGNLVTARGLDNKIGLWVAAEGLRRASLKSKKLQAKIVAFASVQEEIGGHGAAMGAFRVEPDAAIAVDVTQSLDHPGPEKKRFGDQHVGAGPVLGHGGTCHKAINDRLEQIARRKRIELQHEAMPGRTGTDADSIFKARAGIPTTVLSVAQRYMHSPVETLSMADLESAAELLAEFCLDLKAGDKFALKV